MQCPTCASTHIRKNGKKGSKQNHICVYCGRQFIDFYEHQGYSKELKKECLEMYLNDSGFRAIERVKKVQTLADSLSYDRNKLGSTGRKYVTKVS